METEKSFWCQKTPVVYQPPYDSSALLRGFFAKIRADALCAGAALFYLEQSVEDLTDSQRFAFAVLAGCAIETKMQDDQWVLTTRYPVGIVVHNGEILVRELRSQNGYERT